MSVATNIMTALGQGYNIKQILSSLVRNNKALSKNIKAALSQGYTHDQIGEYLTKGRYATHGQKQEMLSGMTQHEAASRIASRGTDWNDVLSKVGTGAAIAGGIGAGAVGLARAVPAIAQGIQGIRGIVGGQPNPTPQGPIGPQPMANAPVQTPPIPPVGPSPTQATPTPPPVPDSHGSSSRNSHSYCIRPHRKRLPRTWPIYRKANQERNVSKRSCC